MKIKYLILSLSIAFLTTSTPALADVVIGETCSTLGTSQMTTDHKDIAICLEKDDSTDLVWKGSTKSSLGSGYFCGRSGASASMSNANVSKYYTPQDSGGLLETGSIITCGAFTQNCISTILKCEGQDPVVRINSRKYKVNCPDGYKLMKEKNAHTASYSTGRGYADNGPQTITSVNITYTCVSE